MLEIKDEEDKEPSMNQDMIRFMAFCCENGISLKFLNPEEGKIVEFYTLDGDIFDNCNFSDLYYPKNLLRTLKEKLSEITECLMD